MSNAFIGTLVSHCCHLEDTACFMAIIMTALSILRDHRKGLGNYKAVNSLPVQANAVLLSTAPDRLTFSRATQS